MSAFERGLSSIAAGRFGDAAEALTQAAQAEPANPSAWRYLALAYFRLHDYAGAEGPVRQVALLTPGDPAAHLNLGVVLRKQGDFDGARRALEEALRLRPDYNDAQRELSKLGVASVVTGDVLSERW